MNRPVVTIIFSCLIIGILISGNGHYIYGAGFHRNSFLERKQDSTDFIRHIRVDSFKLKILPPSSGVQFYKDGIVFLSRSKDEEKMLTNHISFGTIEAYYAIPQDTIPGKQTIFSQTPSFSYPCEGVTFNTDFNTMYFSMIPNRNAKEKIYAANFRNQDQKKSGWVPEKTPLSFCSGNSTYTHPALSSDENIMIFASDMEGSFGGMDLFIARKKGEQWSGVENLGQLINTAGNEFFPFLDSDNNLYFSSDGLPGYGGFDIFSCKFNGETWDKPLNLSNNINSKNDDIAFTINRMDGKTAFYTCRQKSNNAEMQLYKVTLDKAAPESDLLSLSHVFNGKPAIKSIIMDENIKSGISDKIAENIPPPETNTKPEDKKEVIEVPTPPIEPPVSEKPSEPVPVKVETTTKVLPVISDKKDVVIYRVQFLSTTASKGKFNVAVDRKSYDAFEYFYMGAYRYTIGEFSTLAPARDLQLAVRKSGYQGAFVVAFVNNVRSLDTALFK